MNTRVGFVTCVKLGLSCIEEILRLDGKLDLLITLKDNIGVNKSGRIYLDDISEEYDIPLLKINNINEDKVIDKIKDFNIDWLLIIGWSQVAKVELLEAPNKGCIGMHPTLLPVGRGRASIPWTIIKGLDKTGVTMFKIDKGIDTGDIIGQRLISLDENINATMLYKEINLLHIKLIYDYWEDIVNNNIKLIEQNENEATNWGARRPSDGEIFDHMTMEEADKLVRAVTHPYPGAFYYNQNTNRKIIIWSAKTSADNGAIKLKDGYLTPVDYETKVN